MKNDFFKIKSTRKNEKVIYKHYEYNFSSKNTATETWRCVERACKGRIVYNLVSQDISIIGEHSHSPPVFNVMRQMYNKQIITYAETTEYSSSKIYDLIIEGVSSFDCLLIKKKNVHKLVSSTRKKQDFLYSDNNTQIPSFLFTTQRDETFLMHREEKDGQQTLILATVENLQLLRCSKTWIADGTFKSCPTNYYQLYVIFGEFMDRYVPLVYVLLDGKSIKHYDILFKYLMEKMEGYEPAYLILDNEKAVQSSFSSFFHSTKIFLCFFHYSQAIFRKVQRLGYSLEYMQRKKLYEGVSMLRSLVFVPLEKVVCEFNKVKNFFKKIKPENENFATTLISYYERNYISDISVSRKTNLVERLKKDIPITTNVAESFNRSLNSKFETSTPNICKFLKVIRSFQQDTENLILDLAMDPTQQERLNQDYSLRKENLVIVIERYDKYHGLLFLKAICGINAGLIAEFDIIHETHIDEEAVTDQ